MLYSGSKWRSLGLCVAFMLGIMCAEAYAFVGTEPSEPNQYPVESVQLVIVAGKTAFAVFEGEELGNLLDDIPTSPTGTYASMGDVPDESRIRIIFIRDGETLDSLDSADIEALHSLSETGAFIGIPGDGHHMRDVLNIADASDSTDVDDAQNKIFFTYGVPDGARDDIAISMQFDPSMGELLGVLLEWVDRILAAQGLTEQASSAWNATYSHEWRGLLYDKATYRFLISVDKLDTTSSKNDWYLVQSSYQSAISGYVCSYWGNINRCGPYTYAMDLEATIDSSNGAKLYDYMPTGTVASTTESFTIGVSLSGTKPGASASFSKTYSAPDVVIADQSDYVRNRAKWLITLRGPSYYFPFIKQPCNAARNSYQTDPAFIVEIPKNKRLKLTLQPKIGQMLDDTFNWGIFYTGINERIKKYWNTKPMTVKVGP